MYLKSFFALPHTVKIPETDVRPNNHLCQNYCREGKMERKLDLSRMLTVT